MIALCLHQCQDSCWEQKTEYNENRFGRRLEVNKVTNISVSLIWVNLVQNELSRQISICGRWAFIECVCRSVVEGPNLSLHLSCRKKNKKMSFSERRIVATTLKQMVLLTAHFPLITINTQPPSAVSCRVQQSPLKACVTIICKQGSAASIFIGNCSTLISCANVLAMHNNARKALSRFMVVMFSLDE